MAGPGDTDDREDLYRRVTGREPYSDPELHARISATCARIEACCDGVMTAAIIPPRQVREVEFGEQNFDALFMPRFICRTCGPTNRVCSDETGFICIVCQQAAAYYVFDQVKYQPTV